MMIKKLFILLCITAVCLTFAACENGGEAEAPASDIVEFKTVEPDILPGETLKLDYSVPDGKTVEFSSSDASVLTVDNEGVITGITNGTATVIASTGEYEKAYITVTVRQDTVQPRLNAVLSANEIEMVAGSEYDLSVAAVYGGDEVDFTDDWESSSDAVVTVDGGKLTANAPGKATVKVTVTAGGETVVRECVVNVYEHYVIELEKSLIEAPLGLRFSLGAAVYDDSGNRITPSAGELVPITSNPGAIEIADGAFRVIGIGTASVGYTYKGNTASIPVDIFSITADFFPGSVTDYYGEQGGRTFCGVLFASSVYQPYLHFSESGIQRIKDYAAANGYTDLAIGTYAILFNNLYVINGRYAPRGEWAETVVPISEIGEDFYFWSQSEGLTEVYMTFEFR